MQNRSLRNATDVATTGFNIQGQIGGSKKPLDVCNPTFFPSGRACSLSVFFSTVRYFLRLFLQFLRRTPFYSSLTQRSRLLVRRNWQSSFRRERDRRRRNLVESKAKQTRPAVVDPGRLRKSNLIAVRLSRNSRSSANLVYGDFEKLRRNA